VIRYTEIETPVGRLRVVADEQGLVSLSFPDSWSADDKPQGWTADRKFFLETEAALKNFFARGKALTGFKLGARRGTEFQFKVWDAIAKIPFGETRSYGEIAEAIGHPGAARAVGTACGANPLPLFVPCHRVLAARGAIGGYGPTGIETKKRLLKIEGSWES
jgi:methylated-DNA-[protein]-cysteine S-methyltransferase